MAHKTFHLINNILHPNERDGDKKYSQTIYKIILILLLCLHCITHQNFMKILFGFGIQLDQP